VHLSSSDFNFKLIASFPKADGRPYMKRVFEADTVQGMLMVDGYLTTLGKEQKELLKESYPLANLRSCWVLVEGRRRLTEAAARAYQLGGAALVLAALIIVGWRATRQTA
jgi:hypothetical protein